MLNQSPDNNIINIKDKHTKVDHIDQVFCNTINLLNELIESEDMLLHRLSFKLLKTNLEEIKDILKDHEERLEELESIRVSNKN